MSDHWSSLPEDGGPAFVSAPSADESQPLPPQPRGFWGRWLCLTAFPQSSALLNARERERLRRSRLLSVLLLALLMVLVGLFPKSFIPQLDIGTLGGVILASVIAIGSILLNRHGRVNAAGLVFVVGIAVAIAFSLLLTPNGLGMQDLPTFDLFVAPVVLASILLPRQAPFAIWGSCVIFMVLAVTFEHHQPEFAAYVRQVGLYATIILPVILSFILAVVSWLAAGSVERALIESDRTRDLERAYRLIAERKNHLEYAILAIQGVYSRVANGDLSARADLTSGELLPLAMGLNLMLDRLQHSQTAEYVLGNLEVDLNKLNEVVFALAQGRWQNEIRQHQVGRFKTAAALLEYLRRSLLQTFGRAYCLVREISATTTPLLAAQQEMGITLKAIHQEIYACKLVRVNLVDIRKRLVELVMSWEHMLGPQDTRAIISLRRADLRSLYTSIEQLENELSNNLLQMEQIETVTLQLVTQSSFGGDGHEDHRKQMAILERKLRQASEQLEQLLVQFTGCRR